MCTPNRNRPHHRSSAFGLVILSLTVILLCAAPGAATDNVAYYTVSQNGSVVYANISFSDLDTFYLLTPGFIGDESELTGIKDLRLTNESGIAVTPKNSKGTYTFPKGNYTLQYTAPISNNQLYLRYVAPFNVTVLIPDPHTTGNLFLGQPSKGGIVTTENSSTIVTYIETKQAVIPIYEKNRPMILCIFVGAWLVIMLIAVWRYRTLKKRQLDPKKYE